MNNSTLGNAMNLTFIDGIAQIRSGKSPRKFAIFDPARGSRGVIEIRHNGEVCEIDVAELLKVAETRNFPTRVGR